MSGGPETIRKNYHLAWETFEHLLVLYPTEPRVMLIKDISDFSPWTSFRSIATKQDWKLSNMFAALELNLELKATCVQDQGAETYIPNDGAAKFEYWYGVEEAFEKPKVPLELPVGDLTVSTDPFTSRRRWHSAVHATGCARLDGPELLVYMGTQMAKIRAYTTADWNGSNNRRYDCNAAGALCNNPTAPDAEVNYPSDSRVTVTWAAQGGGADANGVEITARVVDQKWTACPMKWKHWPANGFVYLGDTSRGDCSGKRSGSGTSYSGSFSGEIEAWDVVFKARARNSNRGSIKVCVTKNTSSTGSDKGCKSTGNKPANLSGWTTVAGLVYY